jgi:hypothetical protein
VDRPVPKPHLGCPDDLLPFLGPWNSNSPKRK